MARVEEPKNEEGEDEITETLPEEALREKNESDDLKTKLKEMEDKYLRTYADLENYRKRVAREKEEIAQATSERLLRELLDVKDHLELALAHSHELQEVKGLQEGVHLTLKQMVKFLEKFGVQELPALGEMFDPSFHEAIHQEESAEYKPGSVVHVYQKGYLFNGRLLRPARVTVAASPKKTE
jgi:molecular chaperone GrpE